VTAPDEIPLPDDNTTLLEVFGSYERAGFGGEFSVGDDGLVLCLSCRARTDPSDLEELALRRLQGASDPGRAAPSLASPDDTC
jgi:hypothetical protein